MNSGPQATSGLLIRLALAALAGALGLTGAGLLCHAALHGLVRLMPAPSAAALLGAVLLGLSGAAFTALDRRDRVPPVPPGGAPPAVFVAFLLPRRLTRRG